MRDHGMFNFLREGSGKNASGDLEVLKEFAKEAAQGFLGKERLPLNHTIQKTAQVENLTPDHIAIICREANKAVHEQMFKTAENKYVDFELAEPEVIVSNLELKLSKTASINKEAPEQLFYDAVEKVASKSVAGFGDEFDFAPGEKSSIDSDFSFTKQAGHDGLKTPQSHLDKVAQMKKEAQLQEINSQYIVNQAQIEGAEKRFIKEARNLLMPYGLGERADKYAYIAAFCKEAGLDRNYFNKLSSDLEAVMKAQGLLEKNASLKADEKYISDDLDARVINGDHAMVIHIKTLVDKNKRKELLKNKYNWIQTEFDECENGDGAILGQKVKEL
jgi:hypothetical protein